MDGLNPKLQLKTIRFKHPLRSIPFFCPPFAPGKFQITGQKMAKEMDKKRLFSRVIWRKSSHTDKK
jgi:hypothetical protein